MTLLENRLAAAGDQLDSLIETQLLGPSTDDRNTPASARSRALAAAACLLLVLVAGLGWGTRDSDVSRSDATVLPGIDDPTADVTTPPTGPAPANSTELISGSSVAALPPECWDRSPTPPSLVAAATDGGGGRIEYLVAESEMSFVEVFRVAGSNDTLMASCTPAAVADLHPSVPWAVASTYSANDPSLALRGRTAPGTALVEVTLSSGTVVRAEPTADGWFLEIVPVTSDDAMSPPTVSSVVALPTDPAIVPGSTVPVADRPPLAIGESVMLGAAPQLQAGGFVVNADASRQGEVTAEIIGQYRSTGQIGTTVVIQVGTNGPASQETYDRIMSHLPPEEVEQVIFLTVSAPSRSWIEPNNALLWGLQARYPNVKVLDWAGLVESGQVPGLAADGIHLGTEAAKQWYANYVFDLSGRRDLVQPLPD